MIRPQRVPHFAERLPRDAVARTTQVPSKYCRPHMAIELRFACPACNQEFDCESGEPVAHELRTCRCGLIIQIEEDCAFVWRRRAFTGDRARAAVSILLAAVVAAGAGIGVYSGLMLLERGAVSAVAAAIKANKPKDQARLAVWERGR
jgi:hypothetical protein